MLFSLKHKKSSQFPCSRNRWGKAGAQHGQVRITWSGWKTGGKYLGSKNRALHSRKNLGITAWDCKCGVRIDEAQLKLSLWRNMRTIKKGFYRQINQKKARQNKPHCSSKWDRRTGSRWHGGHFSLRIALPTALKQTEYKTLGKWSPTQDRTKDNRLNGKT